MAEDSPGSWFTDDDYPPSALRDNLQGPVTFRYTVGADGLARDCRVTKSSGSVVLDGTACGVFTLHARYWPARDRAGRVVAESDTQTVRWQIPKD
ncbi:energy transducer TonB [Sphingomonas chungangi]